MYLFPCFSDATPIKLPEDSHGSTKMRYKENHHGSMNLVDHRSCERRPTSTKGNPWLRRSRSCTVARGSSQERGPTPLCQGINLTMKKHMNILQCPILRNRADYAKHNLTSSPWDSHKVPCKIGVPTFHKRRLLGGEFS